MKLKLSKLIGALTASVMAISMFPAVPSSAANVGDVLRVGNGNPNQHKNVCDGYSYEIWLDNTGGSGSMTLGKGATFKAEWSASVSRGNFLARRGLDFGSKQKATSYDYIGMDYAATYSQSGSGGNSRLCVYGWFENQGAAGNPPLVEYYIIEDWVNWRPTANGAAKTVTIDGGEYEIFAIDHTGPTIHGNTETFKQYFSVRKNTRTSGHITVSDHFKAWADQGWGIGNLYEVALNAEGWESSGVADVTMLDVYTDPNKGGGNGGGNGGNGGNGGGNGGGNTTVTPPDPSDDGSYFKSDFESGAGKWTGRGSASVTTDSKNYYSGSKSLYVSGRQQEWNGAAISLDSSTFVPGNAYSFSTGVLQRSGSAQSMKMTLEYTDSSGTKNYDEVASTTAASGEWTLLENTSYTIPSGASNLVLYVEAPDSTTDFYLDDAMGAAKGTKSSVTTGKGTVQAGTTGGSSTVTPADSDSLRGKFGDLFKMGTSVSPNELGSGANFIKKHFNSITPENELKPDAILKQGSTDNNRCIVDISRADQTLKFCEQNGIAVRGHTFVWYSQTPEWFFKENFNANGAWVSKETMNKRLENFIKDTFEQIAKKYPKLDLYAYDVCNELFVNDGGGLRPAGGPYNGGSYWAQVYGANNDEFILNAFKYARMYAPKNCKLYINDYNEYMGAKCDDIYNIAMKVKAEGNIDGIGMQSHLATNYPDKETYGKALDKFISTGLDVQITELDIQTKDGGDTARANLFKDIFELAVERYEHISSFTVWGTHDDISWRRSDSPLMFGSNYTPKQDYNLVMSIDVPEVGSSGGQNPAVTTGSASSGNVIWGDANDDGIVSMADAAAILQYLGNSEQFPLPTDGKVAADVFENGSGITPKDALAIQQYMAGIVKELPIGGVKVTTTKATTKTTTTTAKTTAAPVTTTKAPALGGTDISWIDPNKPMIAISFDDGTKDPGKRIIDAIAKEGFHATFFYVGNWINNPDQVKYAYSKGMEIANHTMSHPYLNQKSANEIRQEADGCHNKLKSIIGAEPSKVLRLPYLANSQTVQSTLNDYALITCAIDTQDWNGASKDQIVNTVKNAMANGSANGAIVLCHETYESTAAAMEELCPYIKSQGWQLVTISEMAAAKGKTIGGGQVYTKL